MKFAKKIIAAFAVSAAFAAPAFADTIAMADLSITGFTIVSPFGNVTSNAIKITSETRTGSASSRFNNVAGTGVGDPDGESFVVGGTLDLGYRCAGPNCGTAAAIYGGPVENNSTAHLGTGLGNFAIGDMLIAGSAIAGGASGLTRADASITGGPATASAKSIISNSVTATAIFTAVSNLPAQFKLSYNAYVAAIVGAASGFSGNSLATIAWNLTLQHEVLVGGVLKFVDLYKWSPDELNVNFTANEAGGDSIYNPGASGPIFSDIINLVSGRKYKLAISQSSTAAIQEVRDVPEPGSMFLVALGLFGLGVASRRRSK